MDEPFSNRRLALKAVEEHGIGFQIRVRNLERNHAAVAAVHGAIDRRHAAARHRSFNAVRIDLGAGFQAVEETHSELFS